MGRRLAAALLGAVVAWAGVASARPYGVEDLLATETFGRVAIDPTGRWLVFEQRDPYASGARFDYNTLTSWSLSRLRRLDLRDPASAVTPLAAAAGPGVLIAGFSPDGARLAVYRLQGRTWSLGIVTLATGEAAWLGVTPQEVGAGRALQWVSDHELLVIARTDGRPPLTLRRGFVLAQRLPALWAAAAQGRTAYTVLGSGRYAGLRRRAPENLLLRIDAVSGRQTVLARGAFTDLELSPDRTRVALLSTGEDLQPRADGPARGPRGLETEASRLEILNLRTGARTTPCPTCDVLPQLLSWSPSGRRLLVYDRGADGLWTSGRLRVVDAVSGGVTTADASLRPRLDQNPVGLWTAWMGETPLILGRLSGGDRDDWFGVGRAGPVNLTARLPAPPELGRRVASDRRLTVLAGREAWTVDGGGRLLEARHVGEVRTAPTVAEGARLTRAPAGSWPVAVRARPGAPSHLLHLEPGGLVGEPLPWDGSPLLAMGRGMAVSQSTDPHGVARLVMSRPRSPAIVLAVINRHLAETDPVIVRAVRHLGADGRERVSWLYLPAQPGRRPLVVRPYLGASPAAPPTTAPGELGAMLSTRVLTGHGYAVLVPALPAPPGGLAEPARGVADEILRAVDAALTDPQVGARLDPHRLAIAGYSFGGYTTLVALTQTDRFQAAVSVSGLSDLTAAWSGLSAFSQVEPEGGYTSNWRTGAIESTQPELGAPPWANPERYVRNSPLYAADRIRTPLLLLHGAQDQVPLAQSEAMYSALFRQGKDAQLVTYFGALHTFTSPGDLRDAYARIFGFLDEQFAEVSRGVEAP